MFKDKPWKKWKTRKLTLMFSVLCVCIYIAIGIVMAYYDKMLDSTLTSEVFDFFKWLTITGCAITVAKVVKGETNSDSDEYFTLEEVEEEIGGEE